MNPHIQATEDQMNRRYNGARLHDRHIDEMLGIIKGVLCMTVDKRTARMRSASLSVWPTSPSRRKRSPAELSAWPSRDNLFFFMEIRMNAGS